MDNIIVRHIKLPDTIHGFTARDPEGDYNIYINDRIGYFQQEKTIRHEMKHIAEEHFEEHDVDLIEDKAHR